MHSADKMHHTPTICKGSYLLPLVIESYRKGLIDFKEFKENENMNAYKKKYKTIGECFLWIFLKT